MSEGQFHLGEFKTVRKLGAGRFGKVLLLSTPKDHHLSTLKCDDSWLYAVKIVSNHKFDKPLLNLSNANDVKKINNEIKIANYLHKFGHPNLLELYSIISNENPSLKVNKYYFIMEYCPLGELTLYNFIQSPTDPKECSLEHAQQKIRDIVLGIEFLHLNEIVHRDIKPSNLLIDSRGTVKISDMGTSYKLTGVLAEDSFELIRNPVGTPLFLPPELCTDSPIDPAKSSRLRKLGLFSSHSNSRNKEDELCYEIDVWAFGITLYYLFFASFPFYNENEFRLFKDIAENELVLPGRPGDCFLLRRLINDTNFDAQISLTIASYFSTLCDLLRSLLAKNPQNRLSIKALKHHKLFSFYSKGRKEHNESFIKYNEKFLRTHARQDLQFSIRHSKSSDLLNPSAQDSVSTSNASRFQGLSRLFNSRSSNSEEANSEATDATITEANVSHHSLNINTDSSGSSESSLNSSNICFPAVEQRSGSTYAQPGKLLNFINDSSVSLPILNSKSQPGFHQKQHAAHRHRHTKIDNLQGKDSPTPATVESTSISASPVPSASLVSPATKTTATFPSPRQPWIPAQESVFSQTNDWQLVDPRRDSLATIATINTLPSKLSDTLSPGMFQGGFEEVTEHNKQDGTSKTVTTAPQAKSGLVRSQVTTNLSRIKNSKRMNFENVLTQSKVEGDNSPKPTASKPHASYYSMDDYLNNL